MAAVVLETFKDVGIRINNVSGNMTKFYQPLDLAVNGYCKRFLKCQFNEWYLGEVIAQINNGVEIDNVPVD